MDNTEFLGRLIVALTALCSLFIPLMTQITKLARQMATTNTLLSEMVKKTEKAANDVHVHDIRLENHEQRIHRLEEDIHS